jgi:hypothetical protein
MSEMNGEISLSWLSTSKIEFKNFMLHQYRIPLIFQCTYLPKTKNGASSLSQILR